jgi:hypothetical protein
VTGNHLEGTPTAIEQRQAEMDAVHAEMFAERNKSRGNGKVNTPSVLPNLDDEELLDKAFNAKNGGDVWRLFHGDISEYGSHSEADLALCSLLGFYTGPDPQKLDRLFRASDLYRPKWDDQRGGSTYGQLTISKVLEGGREFYGQNGHIANGHRTEAGATSSYIPSQPKWPDPMAEDAFHGLAGDVVRAIEPHTEASREALLINFLVAFGNAVDTGPHALAEADRHGCNLFAVLVGQTSKGSKGSSWGHIRELFKRADPQWADNRILGGLSSGEGLIWSVRDPISKKEPIKEKGRHTGEYQAIEVDPGISDKRLMVMEAEFASVLQVMARETNTLSAIIRQSWDSGTLRTMTKNTPAQATGAHISILGHITQEELTRHLSETEAANGFGNRFLWVCTKRGRVLPEGGGEPHYNELIQHLHNALELGRSLGHVKRDDQAREAWSMVYPDLSEGQPGLFGAITNRAEAQVLRLSVLYAALDGSRVIQFPHLEASLAVWQYAEASARCIFGEATGDSVADRILEALGNGEMDRTAMIHLFGRHMSAARISQSLSMLQAASRVRMERRDSEGGRPREVWTLA